MAKLRGLSARQHLRCILSEFRDRQSIFGLSQAKFFQGNAGLDFSVDFHGQRPATPLGPAAGPHTQLAQNIILSYLGGSRIFELKTVQILDELEIPRPCIDARNVCYNVEWSQELKLEESQEEYFTAWILLKMIEELELLGKPKGDPFYRFAFDLSAGYDLKGISSPRMKSWIQSFLKPQEHLGPMITELAKEFPQVRNLNLSEAISDSLTLSTFHGCPKDEIEAIVRHLILEHGLHVVVKMNPTLLGYDFVQKTLIEDLGYKNIKLDAKAFAGDLSFGDAVPMLKRLNQLALEKGRNFGAKFSNTLVVQNQENLFSDKIMYLSGTPLHVLAMNTMKRIQDEMPAGFHISFSGGIDRENFVDAILCGMKPVSTCTDLLKKGGYGRLKGYMDALTEQMTTNQVSTIDGLLQACSGKSGTARSEAALLNARRIVPLLIRNPRYHYNQNSQLPEQIDTKLEFFDCITCNVCLPVCPNSANFWIATGKCSVPMINFKFQGGKLVAIPGGEFSLMRPRQIGNLAEFCNDCGNCDTFCPEDGAPYRAKPRFFISEKSYREFSQDNGFCFKTSEEMLGRIEGVEYRLQAGPGDCKFVFDISGFRLHLNADGSLVRMENLSGKIAAIGMLVEMRPFYVMTALLAGLNNTPKTFAKVLLVERNQ